MHRLCEYQDNPPWWSMSEPSYCEKQAIHFYVDKRYGGLRWLCDDHKLESNECKNYIQMNKEEFICWKIMNS